MTTTYYGSSDGSGPDPELLQSIMGATRWTEMYDQELHDTSHVPSESVMPSTPSPWKKPPSTYLPTSPGVTDVSSPGLPPSAGRVETDSDDSHRTYHTTHTTKEAFVEPPKLRMPFSELSGDDDDDDDRDEDSEEIMPDTKGRTSNLSDDEEESRRMKASFMPGKVDIDSQFYRDASHFLANDQDNHDANTYASYEETNDGSGVPSTGYEYTKDPTTAYSGAPLPMPTYASQAPIGQPRMGPSERREDAKLNSNSQELESKSATLSNITEVSEEYDEEDGTSSQNEESSRGYSARSPTPTDIIREHAPTLNDATGIEPQDPEFMDCTTGGEPSPDRARPRRRRWFGSSGSSEPSYESSISHKKTWADWISDGKSLYRSVYSGVRTGLSVAGSYFGMDRTGVYSKYDPTSASGLRDTAYSGHTGFRERTRQTIGTFMSMASRFTRQTGRSRVGWRGF